MGEVHKLQVVEILQKNKKDRHSCKDMGLVRMPGDQGGTARGVLPGSGLA